MLSKIGAKSQVAPIRTLHLSRSHRLTAGRSAQRSILQPAGARQIRGQHEHGSTLWDPTSADWGTETFPGRRSKRLGELGDVADVAAAGEGEISFKR
ncbi:hypothetical protein E4U30_004173, partial [Claviceps sp. LM220 group G6]